MTTTFEAGSVDRTEDLRRALLRRRLRGLGGLADRAVIGRANRDEPLPLSHGQQSLWFLDRLQPDSAEYAVPMVRRLTGPLDVAALRRSLDELVRRHEALRTTYRADGDAPRQVVGPPAPVDLSIVDLADYSSTVDDVLAAFVGQPFDLSAGPVLRVLLIRESAQRHVLALNLHHITCDGWSCAILMRELRALYAAHAAGVAPALPPPRLQYADFARWQRDQAAGSGQAADPSAEAADLEYWRRRLSGLEPLELPTDRPRPATRDPSGDCVAFTVPSPVARAVRAAGQERGATPFMSLLAAVFVLLGRHTDRRDVAVGTPVAGRTRAEVEDVVGYFVNTMVVRGDLAGDPSFSELVARVRDALMADYARQDVPFERLVRELAPARDLSGTPLIQVMFVEYEAEPASPWSPALTATTVAAPATAAKFDLTVALTWRVDGGLDGVLEYATALFDRDRMVRMAAHLVGLLTQIAARPGARLSELELLPPAERSRVLVEWNDTAAPYPDDCLHERVAAQAARTPDAVAVRCGDVRLTYAELDRWANQIAHHLRSSGVGVETAVGILCPRGPALLPALLGVLKAGAHYVPLDPAYPPGRQAFMLDEAGATVLVTTSDYRDRPPPTSARIVCLDDGDGGGDAAAIAARPVVAPEVVVDPENLAYVIYTSGSTGRPKGVMITHRGVGHYLAWCAQAYRAHEADGGPVHSSLSFDLTVTGLFLPLLCGRAVTLVPECEHPVVALADALADAAANGERFSFVKLTPAHLEPLRRCLSPPAAGAARHLVVGGEQLTAEALAFWREHAPDVVVANEYGHTETSVANVINLLAAGSAVHTPVSVGRPIWNTTVYLLDDRLRPVPIGVTGELYAGGVGVARGFVGRPALTAQRYVANPFGPGRLYRSGDLARYRPDGRLEFVGRTDHQVKVRGYRIEPGEIEAALLTHPDVVEAVVVVHDGDLAGYVSPTTVDLAGLREHLAARLPGHLVPATLTALAALPLTGNGKIDRTALPPPASAAAGSSAGPLGARTGPCDELELAVSRLWRDLLGGAAVGVTDNFFQAGGHSLLAVAMVDRLQAELGVTVGLAEVFRAPTVRELCARLRERGTGGSGCLVPLSPGRAGAAPLFLVPPTSGSPFPYLPLVQELDPTLPVYGLQAHGYGRGERPLATIEEIAARYLVELAEAAPSGPIRLAGWSMGGSVAFEMAAQLERSGRSVEHLCVIDATVLGVDDFNNPLPDVDASDALGWFSQAVLRLAPQRDPREAMDELLAEARHRGMVSTVADSAVIERMARVYQANKDAIFAYRCTAVVDTDIHLIRSTDAHPEKGRPEVRVESWRARTRGAVHATQVPGDHWSIAEPPHVSTLARAVMAGLTDRTARERPWT